MLAKIVEFTRQLAGAVPALARQAVAKTAGKLLVAAVLDAYRLKIVDPIEQRAQSGPGPPRPRPSVVDELTREPSLDDRPTPDTD